jgi:hypothetical protein
MATKYVARVNGAIVGKRTTKDRTYTHAIVVSRVDHEGRRGLEVVAWCGRPDLAQAEQRHYQRCGFMADIVQAEVA